MSESHESARLRQLLKEVEAVDIPDYPDYKKGVRWGLVCGITAGVLVVLFLLVCGKLEHFWARIVEYGWTALMIAGVVFLVVWAVGAFRPQKI